MTWKKLIATLLLGISLVIALAVNSSAETVIRHRIPNSNFPIARAVEIPANATLVYVSGQVPDLSDRSDPTDTKTQTINVLTKIQDILQDLKLTMGDVVRMQVFLVGDPAKASKMDFAGFMEGYQQFFGTTDQPNLPARSVFQVAGLANPGWLVEIEVTAVRTVNH